MQLLFDFALELEKSSERCKESHTPDSVNELHYFIRLPRGELASLHHVFRNLAEVVFSSGVFNFDDAELLPDQLTPRDCEHTGVYPAHVGKNVRVKMPASPFVRNLR